MSKPHQITNSEVAKLQQLLETNKRAKADTLSPEMCGAIRITLAITDTNATYLAEVLELTKSQVRRHANDKCGCATDVPHVETVKTGVKQYRFSH